MLIGIPVKTIADIILYKVIRQICSSAFCNCLSIQYLVVDRYTHLRLCRNSKIFIQIIGFFCRPILYPVYCSTGKPNDNYKDHQQCNTHVSDTATSFSCSSPSLITYARILVSCSSFSCCRNFASAFSFPLLIGHSSFVHMTPPVCSIFSQLN